MKVFDMDNSLIEPKASAQSSEPEPITQAMLRMAYSQAVSLKRIADVISMLNGAGR